MASRQLTYCERVQNVLREVAIDASDDVLYDVLVDKVHLAIVRDDLQYGPRSRAHIRDAISAEVRARRVSLSRQGADSKVVFTANGKRFYQQMGSSVILAVNDKGLMRMTISQLHEQTEVFFRVVREIKHLFSHFHPQGTILEANEVPNAVRQLFHRIDDLNQQWTEIQHDQAADQAAMRDLINSPSANSDGSRKSIRPCRVRPPPASGVPHTNL